jgi:hypothetical protein
VIQLGALADSGQHPHNPSEAFDPPEPRRLVLLGDEAPACQRCPTQPPGTCRPPEVLHREWWDKSD